MPLVWDSQLQALVETAPPLVYDPALEAYRETEGLVYDHTLEAWKRVWPVRPEVLYLYNDGDECTDVTGGWRSQFNRFSTAEIIRDTDYKIKRNASDITIQNGSSEGQPYIFTRNWINARYYNRLCVLFDCVSSTHPDAHKYQLVIDLYGSDGVLYHWEGLGGVQYNILHEIDISAVAEEISVTLGAYYNSDIIHRVWMAI